ncbi:MAG: hypothetical protein V3S29_00095, partial [bacterium]
MFQKISRPIAQGGKRFARKNVVLGGALLLSALFVISACEEQFDTLTISGDPSGAVGDPDVQLTALYSSAEGYTDVTNSADWLARDPGIAQITGWGLVTPIGPGDTEIVVYYNNLQATHAFGVTGGAAAAPDLQVTLEAVADNLDGSLD